MSTLDLLSQSPVPCYVNGEAFKGSGSYAVKDPHSPSKTLHEVSSVTIADVPKVLEAASKSFKAWRNTPVTQRRDIFNKTVELFKEHQSKFAGIESAETTSAPGWAGFDAFLATDSRVAIVCAEILAESGAVATVALRGEIATTEAGKRAFIKRCPYGTVFSMAPWNAPLVLSMRSVSNPIIGGNVVILKTSEMSPKTQLTLAQLFHDAGLPAGVLNVIHVDPKDAPAVVEAIIAHDSVGKVNFTGSTRVGAIIAATAGKHIKPVVLELGGKAPAIVCHDADLKTAWNAIAFGGWFHSGQICMATQTVIAHESVAEELLQLLNNHKPNVTAAGEGAPLRGLFTEASAQRVKGIIDDAVSKGAKIAVGDAKVEGNVVQPIILKDVTPEMQIYRTEMFAPVFSLITFKDEEEAIRIANDHEYGLSASIYSKDVNRALSLADEIDSGAVHINGASVADGAAHPHGGWKKSGFGRFNGIEGIREFTQLKTVTINEPHGQYPI
ncbi:BZ3500_MvSof-1268-A1-R1_Chr1-3g01756 [Microbotryum saponariae]|uniref:BZ3500_MvSof-1268-A1-R1_Chr1-3g01756 protein n=1 Tax=Microbotryum saponariae TaxID=289078 RepID=A0A2X0KCJ9_9BASI|nr:BZ3500_MvSof-1268-A1-R1_Chr1-3g01756 [Microbotryum saponariae]SCZ94538.1 BZ3501_MvSof-1269-A2-R1_Chr1-3g01358 [Microbotryum saponariae]